MSVANSKPASHRRLHHAAIAVRDMDASLAFYGTRLGLHVAKRSVLAAQGVEVALLGLANSELELIMPLDMSNGIGRFVERRGEGLHHLCFTTPDIRAEMADARARGVEIIESEPREGIAGLVCFFHPRVHAGVLVELVEVGS